MTEQAMAARLKAIAERLKQLGSTICGYTEDGTDCRRDGLAVADWCASCLLDEASIQIAHVETLTQQVAELQASVRQHIADVAELDDDYAALKQENARLTAHADLVARQLALTVADYDEAEQQRDAAHAALKKFGRHGDKCVFSPNVLASTRPEVCTCGLDAALAASAPQKAKCNCYPWEGVHAVDCPTRTAPAQETERGR